MLEWLELYSVTFIVLLITQRHSFTMFVFCPTSLL